MSVDEPAMNHDRPAMICTNDDSNPPQAPSTNVGSNSEAGYSQVKTELPVKSENHEDTQDGGQGPLDWPPQVTANKVYVSYFEREEVEVDNNDK